MARKIRFPLKMKNGEEVRTLEELQQNFDLESVVGYFTAGKLQTWLADRYYDEKADAVGSLSPEMPDLNEKLCRIIGVNYEAENDDTNIEFIQRRNEKLNILREITTNQNILDNVDYVAMNQVELFEILDSAPERVYLYGESFSVPSGAQNVTYIGLNKPVIILENNNLYDYEEQNITFRNVSYEEIVNVYITKGERLYLEGKHSEAFPKLEKAALSGNPRAMYLMARYYNDGYNVVKIDIQQRNKWIKEAFEYNEPLSSEQYASWIIEDKDEKERIWKETAPEIEKLAENNDILAQGSIGIMYDAGRGVAENAVKAAEWYRKAAEQGYARAQYNLGVMYGNGRGVEKDDETAVNWYRKAVEQGYARAQNNLGGMYANGRGVPKDNEKAVEWYTKSAEQGNANAQNNLGCMYRDGEGALQDDEKAVEWYKKAAEQGNACAQCNLGFMYENGRGIAKDTAEAIGWYRKAAEQGDARAKGNLKNLGYSY